MSKCNSYNCKEPSTRRVRINLGLPGWIEENLVDAEFCKPYAKEVEIRTRRAIYYRTYDSYKTEFEDEYTYHDWWYSCKSLFHFVERTELFL